MTKKPKLELSGEPEGGSALSPLVGLAREDMMGAVAALLRETAMRPDMTMKHVQSFNDDVVKIMTGKSDLAPAPKDKRFADAAWSYNPFYRAGVQYYLAMQKTTQNWIEDLEFDELEKNRARFVSAMILDALSPTNTLAGNPSAIKKAIDSGGLSLMKGLKNAYNDIVHNDAIVSQVDKRPFKIGENIATTAGKVVWRTPMMELIQYAPTTDQVHAIPQLTVPPQINKAYINDLTPQKSIVQLQLAAGIQPFLIRPLCQR
jgi:polyhydroxyalkanoate synthase